jgi:RecA/RadA recombinase
MTEKEKATVGYLPAPTGQNQSLASKPINIVPQKNEHFNGEISKNGLKLINMGDVEVERIDWLWFPYIPYGKITVIQGDPGNGKTTMILAIAAAVTNGEPLPEVETAADPINVIFQTAEDGLGDTVKPRLLQAGANCSRVIVIDESEKELSLCDKRIEEALIATGAKLFILDPLQAYLGADVDMHRANEVRPVLKRISLLAEKTGCAVVFVGHLNKGTNQSQYRGLGSIDIQAAARSVLTLGRIKDSPYMRAFAHGKSNLALEGSSIAFELNPDTGFRWAGKHPITIDELLSGKVDRETALERAKEFLITELTGKVIPSNDIFSMADGRDISDRTLKRAKSELNIRSFKKDDVWYWTFDNSTTEAQKQECQQLYIEDFGTLEKTPDNGGIAGFSPLPKKQECQEAHIENLAPLPPSNENGEGLDGES